MNPEQYFSSFVNEAVDKGLKPSQVFNERERLWRENIQPALVKKGANDTDLTNAMKRWQEKTNVPMMQLGFLPKDGQDSRGAAKDLRAERAVRETAKTGSKLPIIKETVLSTADTLANAFGQGASQMVGSTARFANDIGENEKGTKLDQIANFGESNAKAFGKSASSQQNAMQSGEMGKAAQLGIGAVQSIPAMALPAGAAIGGTKVAASLGAKVAAPYLGFGIGAIAGHTQNYGEVRRGSTQNLQRDFPNWQKLQGNPLYEQKLNENINAGLDVEQARQKAHADTLDELSENAADKYGTAMTALDVIAPSGAALGSGILKHLPKNKVGQFLSGGGIDAGLVAREINNSPRVGLAKLLPDTSLQANKAAAKMVAKQGLEEGLQGAVGEYGSQSATANIGGKAVDWKQIGQSFVDEGLIGAVMGGGMQSAAGHSPTGQAKAVAKELRNQTNTLRKDEATARSHLSEAMQFNNPERIAEAESDLQLIQERAKNLNEGYSQHGVETPYFVQRLLPKEPGVNQDEVAQHEPIQTEAIPEPEQSQEAVAEQSPEPAQPSFKPAGYDMANTTNLVVKAVSDGVLSLDQAEAIQKDPIVGAVFGHAVNGDKASAQQTIMEAVSQGAIDLDHAESLSNSIDKFANLQSGSSLINPEVQQEPVKPTLTSIVNNHVNTGINQPELTDFDYTQQRFDPAEADPNLSTFDTLEPQSVQVGQSGIIDEPETQINQESIDAVPLQPNQQQLESGSLTPESQNSATSTEQGDNPLFSGQPTDLNQSFAEKFKDAHLNNPELKPRLINEEIASGRNRANVLKEVNEIVSAVPKQSNKSKSNAFNQQQPAKVKSFSNSAKANEYIRKNNLSESHEPVLVDNIYEVKEKAPPQVPEQKETKNGTLELEEIGRAADNKPFANQQSASLALKKKKLERTHAVVARNGGYVLQRVIPEKPIDQAVNPPTDQPQDPKSSSQQEITELENQVTELNEQRQKIDAEIKAQSEIAAKFYTENYRPSPKTPTGWKDESSQAQYYSLLKATQKLKEQRSDIDSLLKNTNEKLSLTRNSNDPSLAMREKQRKRELEVTSSTYERAQKRLQKDVENWMGFSQPKQNTQVQTENVKQLNAQANEAATSPQNNVPEPTQAQIEAGNYKKGHVKVHGLDISIENPKGSTRSGKRPDGSEWSHTMSDHYGYIKRTTGADNEHIDTYVGNNPESDHVFVVDQLDQQSGGFDEHKVMLGFNDLESATKAYQSNFDQNWKVGPIQSMNMNEFKDWLKNGDTSKPATSTNSKDSLENIRAERLRQKNLVDMHNSVYGLASIEQLQKSLELLNKDIAKAHKQSENEVVNGRRSTRKAVAAGALDRFLKDRLDLESYIKARKSGELSQRVSNINDFGRNKSNRTRLESIKSNSDLGQTHFIPFNLLNQSHKLGDVVEDLASMSSDVESDTQYSESLLRKIAKLNPNIEVVFTNDPKLASGLSEGGHYPFSKDGHEKVFIYPQGNWESDILSLVNHELIHAVTHQAIEQGKVNQELSQLDELQKRLESFYEQNYKKFSDLSQDRLNYGFSDINEFIAVITAESEIRNELKGLLNNESNQQGKSTQELQAATNGQVQQHEQGTAGTTSSSTPTINERSNHEGSTRSSRSDVVIDAQQGFIQQFDNVVQRILLERQKLLKSEQNKQSGDIKDNKRERTSEVQSPKRSIESPDQNSESLDTVFGVLPQSNAIERVSSFLDHLKMPATQDSFSRGRFNVRLDGGTKISGKDSHGFTLQVVASFNDLPKVIQQAATYQDEYGKTQNYSVSGVWHDDMLYVVTDQIHGDRAKQLTTSDAYQELLAHEIIGHFGVQQVFGKEYKTKFQQLYNALGGQSGILKIAKDNGVDVKQFKEAYIDPFTKGIKEGYYDPLDVQQATVSELFAFIAQNEKTRPFVQKKLKELLGYIRQWLRDHGLMSLDKYNDADIMMFLAEARKAVVDRDMFSKFGEQTIAQNMNKKGQHYDTDELQLPQELHSIADLSKSNSNTKDQSIPKFSRNLAANPEDLPESTQQKILDAASKSFFGQATLLGLERSKTISKQTGRLFNTMLHKALQDKDFKVTFDLVQDKINHVTFSSSGSMDVAPDILTQLETGSDYLKESKKVGQQLAHTLNLRDKPEFQKDLEKIGDVLFENTLSEEPKVYSDSELRSKNLNQQQIDLYRQARAAVDTSLDSFAKTTISNIYKHLGGKSDEILAITAMDLTLGGHVNEIADRIAKIVKDDPDKAEAAKVAEEHIEKVITRLEQLKDEGYMPLMRFGKYYMRVIDPTTKEVAYRQHFESEAERNLFVRNYKAPDGYKVESSQINELEHKLFQGVSPETVALFAKEAGLPVGDAEAAYIKHAVRDNHALKRLLRRQGVQGFNADTKRVLAAFVLSNARYAANQLYNPAIDESITEIKDPAYAEDAIRLRDYALDTQEEVAGIKNFAFVWYMGASFMFGVVNLTQPILQTLPYLLQYSTDAGSVPRAFIRAAKSWYGKDIPSKYQDFYERARREGHLDPQNTWMLQGLERGKSGLGANTWQLISHASGFFAQASETVNRRTALFAALDVAENMSKAKLEKLGFKDAYDFAVRTIQETQGVYNKGNRPRVSRGNVGSLLMMYKQFMISYVEQMVRMQRSGLWGGEDDEFKKRMAKLVGFGISRTMLVALGILWSFAGATGLPFMRDLLDVIETAGGMVGKPVNTEREVQIALVNALGDTLGTAATTILLDGPVNLNPVIDVKGRMGMGDLIPATAYFSPMTSEWQKSKELSSVGGAIGGLMDKAGSAMDYAQIGSYGQAVTQLAPKAFTSLGQGTVAAVTGDYRNMQTGVKTNDATILDGFIKMLDAQPSGIAKEGRVRGLEMKDKAALQYVNKRAKEDYEKVLETDDQKQILEFRKAVEDYNATEPRYPITMNLKRAETNFAKSNMNWQEKRKTTKGLDWMDDYNPYLETK